MKPQPAPAAAAALLTLTFTLTACAASYDERMTYLRKIANRGAETHKLLAAQGAHIDAKRCGATYDGLADDDIPSDIDGGGASTEWRAQVRQFFVDSCVTGLPKPVPGHNNPPPASPSTPPTTAQPASPPS
ncbi:hypothetical protein BJF79_03350 [Actinomadura sp. CNU-125]|uniref:hypothetical protein n=1 Tax=Actinomadura sp. CNU-125 TaxID=1904961 RepID=UPI000959A29C|nr:hypothetical protein [Actinomadura sp. CNU-125]OLT12949.1 hypothetical protein BJF79_03350 [Actinomadura sp. CNU-125]